MTMMMKMTKRMMFDIEFAMNNLKDGDSDKTQTVHCKMSNNLGSESNPFPFNCLNLKANSVIWHCCPVTARTLWHGAKILLISYLLCSRVLLKMIKTKTYVGNNFVCLLNTPKFSVAYNLMPMVKYLITFVCPDDCLEEDLDSRLV